MPVLRSVSREERRRRRRERRLKRIAMLPALFTLGNLLFGFTAICCCLLSIKADGADLAEITLGSAHVERVLPTFLSIGAILIAMGLICDGLDGRVARWSRKTSDFGGQLDSLADVITFGAAPALLVICLIISLPEPAGWPTELVTLTRRATWVAAAVYMACGALRLARFNVENIHDESAHYRFKGLPSPGAAGCIASLVVLHEHVRPTLPALAHGIEWALPPVALLLGLLMVSRIRYAHFINVYFRRKRPLWHLVSVLIVVLTVVLKPAWGLAILGCSYALSGPVGTVLRRIFGSAAPTQVAVEQAASETTETDQEPGQAG